MAASNPKKTSDEKEELQLEAELQAMRDEKKEVFEMTREADERLRKIRENERQKHERLHQIRAEKIERDQRERYAAQRKTAKEEMRLQTELEALKSENDRINKELVVLCDERMNVIAELNLLRRKNSAQNESFEKLKVNLQRTTTYSRALQKERREKEEENDRLTRRIMCLEDEIASLRVQHHDQNEPCLPQTAREAEMQAKLEVLSSEIEQLKTDRIKDMMELQVCRRQNESLAELKKNLQHITSLSEAQQKTIKCWEDKFSAAQQVAVETQLRQLNELQSPTDETTELKQILTTQHRQHQQQQPSVAEEHHQGK